MRISELKKREPFNTILIQTLQNVFESEDATASMFFVRRFSWHYFKYFRYIWFCSSYLNFYTDIRSHSKLFEALIKEYSQSKKLILKPLQWLFVNFSTKKLGRILLSSDHLVILSENDFLKNTIILGGNHRIRLLRPMEHTTQVILKDGFRNSWITNEILLRENTYLEKAPKLNKRDFSYLSFEEEYKPGTPINRLDSGKYTFLKDKACRYLYENFSIKYAYPIELKEYKSTLIKRITADFQDSVNNLNADASKSLLSDLLQKFDILITENYKQSKILMTKSHGDFQDANILVDTNGELIIIDWESTHDRWLGYDCFTLMSGSRGGNEVDFAQFTNITQTSSTIHELLITERIDIKLAYLLFCLEELHFQVLNHCEPAFYNPGNQMNEYIEKFTSYIDTITHNINEES